MKKIVIPMIVVLIIVGIAFYLGTQYSKSKKQPLLETFRIVKPLSGKQKNVEYVDKLITFYSSVERAKDKLGYASSFRFPFVGKSVNIGNIGATSGFHYLSNLSFGVSPGMAYCNPSINEAEYHMINKYNANLILTWPGRYRSIVYLWGINNNFLDRHKAGNLKHESMVYGVNKTFDVELSLKEYAYIGDVEKIKKVYFRSDFPFKLKFSNCPEQYYAVNPYSRNGAIYSCDIERELKKRKCRNIKNNSPEGLYIYDPPEFATQGISVTVSIVKR